ncbi:MAG TPA: site-2 protease family protein, partial [Candidatus Binataceae bacterium]|nr:site-2 protease family protein [Candidatus Binataceae bacterium]
MDQAATRNNTSALPAGVVPAEIPRRATAELVEPQVRAEPAIPFWNKALLFLTLFTTTSAGAMMAGYDVSFSHPFSSFLALFRGLSFSIPLMLILGSHEMGHYLTARAHRVDTSFPYFIPVPFFIGTMGAFIRLKAPARTRNAMFDIGAAGPWAGVIVAIPCIVLGL